MAGYDPNTGYWIFEGGGSGAASSVTVTNLPSTQPVSGSVAVNNLPSTQPVSGTVGVNNFPATQPVSGTVTTNPNLPVVSATSSALTAFRNVAVTNTAVAVKTTAGRVHQYHFGNPNTAVTYVHLYNVAAASVTVGTTTPVETFMVAANAALDGYWVNSLVFSTAISVAVSTSATASTAPTNGCLINLGYV